MRSMTTSMIVPPNVKRRKGQMLVPEDRVYRHVDLYLRGLTLKQISETTGVCMSSIYLDLTERIFNLDVKLGDKIQDKIFENTQNRINKFKVNNRGKRTKGGFLKKI